MNIPLFTGFDIETRPLPELVERFCKPYPEFEPASVKCGNLKDPAKIAEKHAQAKADHESERIAYWKAQHDRAALNPFTAEIIVIGLIDEEARTTFLEGAEPDILRAFWKAFECHGDAARKFVFWSGSGSASKMFDLDFIVTRSRIRGVRVPPHARNGRFYASRFIDLASEFLLYQNDQYLSLTRAADILGLYDEDHFEEAHGIFPKSDTDAVTGENFWQHYSDPARKADAMTYLTNDLRHVFHLANRILFPREIAAEAVA